MNHFGIYSPVLGLRKDFPSVLLDKAFTPDAENIQYWNGEIRTAKMRRKMFLRQSFACSPSSEVIYVDGDITNAIADNSDIVLFDVGNLFNEVYTAVGVNYESGQDRTAITWNGKRPVRLPAAVSRRRI